MLQETLEITKVINVKISKGLTPIHQDPGMVLAISCSSGNMAPEQDPTCTHLVGIKEGLFPSPEPCDYSC